jgi:hypothetical protein
MCLIIKKPAGRRLCDEFIANAWLKNPDGWGSLHLQAGQPLPAKGLALDALLAHNQTLPVHQEVFVHLRKATYGPVNHQLAHPFRVRDGLYLMHNGNIDALAPTDPEQSDTAVLAGLINNLLTGLGARQAARLLRSEGFARLTAPLLQGSMVVLLDHAGAVRLGRDWQVVQTGQWHSGMCGVEVSNTHTWWQAPALAA